MRVTIDHCIRCGTRVEERVPDGDNRPRAVCPKCGHIQYENPKIVVGCIPEWEGKIVIARRAIQPRYGLWTLPAGFMENGETAGEGAAREALEEANAKVEIKELYTVYSLPSISQVYMLFRAQLLDPNVSPGEESLDVKFVDEQEVPWDELAFIMVKRTLRHYFDDRKTGVFIPRVGDILPPER